MATRPIDEKIVAMKMDNSDFVKKASETTKSMGALTNFLNKIPGINFGSTVGQLENIQKSVNGIDASRLANAVDTVASRFSNLGIVGVTALTNITNRVLDAGLAMARKLTIAPIMDGFKEYELQMGSIQTILANTSKYGTDVNDVTKSLGELNEYADKTIYNFGEMTKNIGLFTNAGLELEESVSMIKGFSNAAAASGANAENAARAAYQLSQGMSAGYLMQMDWMSLTNAGMGNDNMKRDLIALGQAMGTLNVNTPTALRDWKELLSDKKWLTADVMSVYLRSMAGELTEAELRTIGLTKAQSQLLLQNAKTGEEAATYVRTFTQMMTTLVEGVGSGWSESFRIMFGGFDEGTKLWSGFSQLINEPFDKLTESRNKFLTTLKDAGVFEEMFVGIGSAIYVIGQGINAVAGGFDKAFSSDKVGIVSSLVQGFKGIVSTLTPSQASLDKISTIFQAMGSNVRVVGTTIAKIGESLFKLVPDNLGTNILNILEKFAKMNIAFNEGILNSQSFKSSFETLGETFSWIGDRIGDVIGGFSQLADHVSEIWTILGTGEAVLNGAFDKDSKLVIWLVAISEAAKSVIKSMGSIELSMTPITKTFQTFFSTLRNGFNWLKEKLAGTVGSIQSAMPTGTELIAGGFVAALATVAAVTFKTIHDITQIFSEWGNVVKGFADTLDSVSGTLDAFALNLHAQSLLIAAFAVGALAGAIFLLSKVDGSKIGTSLTAIVGSLSAVIGALAVMSKYDITGGFKTSVSIIGIAVALSIMSVALKKFGDLKPEEITKGLISMTVILGAIAGSFALMGHFNDKEVAVTAAQIVAMSLSIMMIAKAVRDMGSLNMAQLAKGIGGLALIVASITSAFILMGKFSGNGASASALQFLAIAGSVLMLVGAIKMIANIDSADLLIGLATITAILAVVAGFAALTSGKGLLATSVGLLSISVAMNSLIVPILALGNIPVDKLAIGLLGMSTALLAIAAASQVMNGALLGAASITVMAVALNLLLVPISAFAAMGWGNMLLGVAGLALSLGALAGVSLLLAPAAVPLLAFSAAIGLMGLAMLAVGAGMSLFGTGLLALAGLTSAAVTTIIATLGALVTGITALIPTIVKFVGNIILEIAKVIRDKSPQIIDVIAETLLKMLDKIYQYLPKFVTAIVKILTALIDALAREGPKLVASVVNLLITLVETMATTIEQNGPRFINAFLGLIQSVLTIMVEAGTSTIKAMYGWIPGIEKAMDKVAKTATETIEKNLESARIAEEKGSDFADGLSSKRSVVERSAKDLSESANVGLASFDSKATGGMFATNFATGILNRKLEVQKASAELANAAVDTTNKTLDVNSPGKEGEYSGEMHGVGVAGGVERTTPLVEKSAEKMSEGLLSGMGGVSDKVRNMLFINDSDVKDQEKKASNVGKSYEKASDASTNTQTSNSRKVRDELDKQFTASKEWIEEEKYYKRLSLAKELDAWEKVQTRYKKGSEERKQADREVFRVKNELEKEGFDKSKQWMDDRKYYQKLSLDEELKAWQRVQTRYKVGSEERKQADREVFRLQNELIKKKEEAEKESLDRSKRYIEDAKSFNKLSLVDELTAWERVQKRYKVGTEERKQADREVYRLKNEINQKLISLNEEYVEKIQSANKRLIDEERRLNEEYQNAVNNRTDQLTGFAGLFDDIPEKAAIAGQALIKNLRSQVTTFAEWSANIRTLSARGIDQGLIAQLQQMGPQAAVEIAALTTMTDSELGEYTGLWRTKNELARQQAVGELEGLKHDTSTKIQELRDQTAVELEAFKNEWISKTQEIREGTVDQFVELNTSMADIGTNAIKGLMDGMTNMQPALMAQATAIADSVQATIKKALKIKSPSRVMMGLGEFVTQGLAIGMSNASGLVVSSANKVAEAAKDALSTFLNGFELPDEDRELHFKAVVEYDKFDPRGFGKMAFTPDMSFANNSIAETRAANRQNDNISSSDVVSSKSEGSKSTVINQNLTFNSRQLTPSEVARKNLQASRQLAMQWGV